jgi:iron complex outermembrane receptor protein
VPNDLDPLNPTLAAAGPQALARRAAANPLPDLHVLRPVPHGPRAPHRSTLRPLMASLLAAGLAAALGAPLARAQTPGAVPAPAPTPAPAAEPSPPVPPAPGTPALPGPAPAAGSPTSAAPPAPAAVPPAAARAPAAGAPGQRIEITGGRVSDDEQRRRSTAAKIVIGREEIEKFGDATVGEVLRRLPGVTTPGAPGRGGPPRMRGLGGGFTQLLIDGQRVPPGFSLESLTPEQIERIEILRAPTAETGARAIAGTINIITREGFRRRLNEVRLGLSVEDGQLTPGVFWTHNNSRDALTYNLSIGVFRPWRENRSTTTTTVSDDSGVLRESQTEQVGSEERRQGLHLTGRLQWRLGEQGDQLMLMPSVFHGEGRSTRDSVLDGTRAAGVAATLPDYTRSHTDSRNQNTATRLNLQWRQRLGPGRIELQGGIARFEAESSSERENTGGAQGTSLLRDATASRERSVNLTTKYSTLLGGTPGGDDVHSLVLGAEIEALTRTETRSTTLNGLPLLTDFGDQLSASSRRIAAYAQDEWSLNKHWAFHAGLRWEGITTRGEDDNGVRPENRSSVTTPLLHLLWKPDPTRRDQVRLSLTRSYRAPALATLIARPSVNSRVPLTQSNGPTTADSAGNPGLRPELARGLDLAFERYLDGGGVLSANLFVREIQDLMRRVVSLETVDWAPVPRYVARQRNVGDARTHGLELEAKFRLDQAFPDAPRVEVRSNLSVYRSRVDGVPGPDNRLDSQAKATANVGADYRFRGLPLSVGGNVNVVPGYRTQLSEAESTTTGRKRVFDAYALWTFNPAVALRLLASNLGPLDTVSGRRFREDGLTTASQTVDPSATNWQLRLELKL